MYSIDYQIAQMRKMHPQFEVKIATDWLVVFEGWLSPFKAKKYKIQITMCKFHELEAGEIQGHAPRVEVIEPEIKAAPHLWQNMDTGALSLLHLIHLRLPNIGLPHTIHGVNN